MTHLAPPNWRPRRLSSFCRLFDSTFNAVRPLRNASIIPREACSGAYSIIVSHHSPLTRQFPWKLRKRWWNPSNSRLHAVRVAGDEGMRGPRFLESSANVSSQSSLLSVISLPCSVASFSVLSCMDVCHRNSYISPLRKTATNYAQKEAQVHNTENQ